MDLSIIIVNWNTRDLLAECLTSIYECPPGCCFEVFVVDNASGDGSADMVRLRFPQVRLIWNSHNRGFARANNQAIQTSTATYLLLLNSDTIALRGSADRMMAFLRDHPEAGIVGAWLLNRDGTPQRCFGHFPTVLTETVCACGIDRWPFPPGWLGSQPQPESPWFETDWVLGAALMIRRQLLEAIGLLDEGYFMFSEEIDLAYRARKAGWRTFVLPSAQIIHLGGKSTARDVAAMKAELYHSKVLYFGKHHGAISARLLRVTFAAGIVARRIAYRLRRDTHLFRMWDDAWEAFVAR